MSANRLRTLAAAVAAATAVAAPAAATEAGFDAQIFHAAPGQRTNYFSVSSARVPAHLQWEGAAVLGFALHPIAEQVEGEDDRYPIASLLTLDVLGSIGLFDRLDVGLAIPVVLAQGGDDAEAGTEFLEVDRGAGLGDVRIVPRIRLLSMGSSPTGGGFHLGAKLGLSLPTGSIDSFRGGGFQVNPSLLAEVAGNGGSSLGIEVGYVMRPQAYIAPQGLEIDDAIAWGVAARIKVDESATLLAEAHGEIGYASITEGTGPDFAELLFGGRYFINDSMFAGLGIGRGIVGGVGSPDLRIIGTFAFARTTNTDRDGDGLANGVDECPDQAEDMDGFEDTDGCPDPDNDGDGVLDRPDRCDTELEDMDGFEDGDGCPDPDNDGDGVLDVDDQCPMEAEDVDLFEDGDGCPEPDNDNDGILDGDDDCVDQPEDIDGFRDADGCPDPDNDGDGVLDADDQCDDEAEIINGVDDADGCPEVGSRIQLNLRTGDVTLLDVCEFDGVTSNLAASGLTCASQLAVALSAYPELRLRVVVRTRDRADEAQRLASSERRANAIRAALVAEGIADERIETSPYALPVGTDGPPYELEFRVLR
ncbi:MAG: hypothetical protein H6700_09885 [Myxococcales bacterium]|nr:hypothetical protein [Myxococcales bacterium]MCB9532064.1 hypothetical protein [Myxococcales bacterium]